MQDLNQLKEYLLREEQAAFQGWDFRYLEGRTETGELAWNYRDRVNQYRTPHRTILDMHTGGGEFLLSLGHPYEQTCVTEGWEPNLNLCRERLRPLGITVKAAAADGRIDYAAGRFDLVLNRHGDFLPDEVVRVLKPGGYFITQQVGCDNDRVLSEKLLGKTAGLYPGHDLEHNVAALREAGMKVLEQKETITEMRFYDLGAVVYLARQLPWEFPGFSVACHFPAIAALQDELEQYGYISNRVHRFLIVAEKL